MLSDKRRQMEIKNKIFDRSKNKSVFGLKFNEKWSIRPPGVRIYRKIDIMRFTMLFLPILFYAASAGAGDQIGIDERNWMNHPEIASIRHMCEKIENQIKADRLSVKKNKFEYCAPHEDTKRIIYFNSRGAVYKYIKAGGSEDSARKASFYYDGEGKLKFAFITGGAVNGTRFERRIYFNDRGRRIWENHRIVKGPGYTYPGVWPESDTEHDPGQGFNSAPKCKN
jgi:hypothetical protein